MAYSTKPHTWVTGTNEMSTPHGNHVAISKMLQRKSVSSTELIHGSQDHNWLKDDSKHCWQQSSNFTRSAIKIQWDTSTRQDFHTESATTKQTSYAELTGSFDHVICHMEHTIWMFIQWIATLLDARRLMRRMLTVEKCWLLQDFKASVDGLVQSQWLIGQVIFKRG